MTRPTKKLKKNQNGSINVRVTIPPELADDAILLQEMGYTPFDWVRIGILTMKDRKGSVKI